ncbi:hypothetical protein QFZ89_003734 [Paraburkholderia youngii]
MGKVNAAAAAVDVETIRQDAAESEFPTLVQVILAGGSGTRLWPVSREQFPKQLIDVIGKQTLLQATMGRMAGFDAAWNVAADPVIVCGTEHYFATYEQAARDRRERADRGRACASRYGAGTDACRADGMH